MEGDTVMAMEISFPGGKKVDAFFQGFTIKTDQSEKDGGEGSAPTPSFLFLASLGTCAGIFALNFCQKRKIDTAAGFSGKIHTGNRQSGGSLLCQKAPA